MSSATILVCGATGYLGKFLVREAKVRGLRVKALARSAEKLGEVRELVDDIVVAQATEPETLKGICEDVDIVVSSVGITRQNDRVTYRDVDYAANVNILREAESSHRTKRMVYVSVLHPEMAKHTDMVAAKEAFVCELKASSLCEWVVIRPGAFFCDVAEYLDMAKGGRCWVFGSGEARINPIHGWDLAVVCIDACLRDDAAKTEVEVGGPETFSAREIAELAFRTIGKEPVITGVPVGLAAFAIACVKPFNRRWWNMGSFFLAASRQDALGPPHGHRLLADDFRERYQKA